jgi:hypothetical protein
MTIRWTSGFLLGLALAACEDAGAPPAPVRLEVLAPTGAVAITQLHAARLDGLAGTVICELSDYMWEANRILPEARRALAAQYPDATIVAFDELPDVYGVAVDVLTDQVLAKRCESAILASAG